MKCKIISIYGILMIMLLTSCGIDPIADDVTNYMNNQMPAIIELQNNYLTSLSSISESTDMDAKTVITKLNDEVIPKSNKLIAEAKKIVPATEEVRTLHNKYIAALTKQNSGLTKMLEGLQNKNRETVTSGSKIITEANTEYTEFVNQLNALAKAHGLEVQN